MRAADLLREYLRGLCSASGAGGASLYVPALQGVRAKPTLYHVGQPPPIPELADLVHAESLRRELAAQVAALEDAASAWRVVVAASRASDGRLVGLFPEPFVRGPDRRRPGRSDGPDARRPCPALPDVLLGLRLAGAGPAEVDLVGLAERSETPRGLSGGPARLLLFARELAWHASHVSEILDDPITRLPGRAEFQAWLEREIGRVRQDGRALTLLMINPDDFAALNERVSYEAADRVIGEIADRLRGSQRGSDIVARYGSVVFASILLETGLEEGRRRAEEILRRLHERPYLGGTVPVSFSAGVASFEAGSEPVRRGFDLIQRANLALGAAKRAGGGCVRAWEPDADQAEISHPDRLLGIFTGQMSRDYRNMAVLSDTVAVVAGAADFQELATLVVRGLYAALKLDRVGVFEWRGSEPRLVYGVSTRAVPGALPELVPSLSIDDDERALLEQARSSQGAVERQAVAARDTDAFAVPLRAGDSFLGVLYLVPGRLRSLTLDSEDLVFLEALATQIALALDRARLAAEQRLRQEQERRRLQAEVDELRSALSRNQLLYRSPQMEALVATARRVATTDATVLITGESGTGKEMVARAIHQLSPRIDHAFVVVDCGAIPTALIESELFGHEKGAFTGAHQRRIGRLVQADKGSLLLDEIGELPLEVQSRLLRFVQEKQVTPVGGGTSRTVDVRVLAATNRDLQAEVDAGRFRADLYYRLHVVHLEIPPLRKRPDDLLQLVRHFSDLYSAMYDRGPLRLSAEAESVVLRHAWPGNVRELQNRMMRAVILCQGSEITPADLGLSRQETPWSPEPPAPGSGPEPGAAEPAAPASTEVASGAAGDWGELRAALRRQVEEALARESTHPAPLGRWLAEDLVLEADAAARGVASQAAALLGMPESTFRRRLESAAAKARSGWSPRSPSWAGLRTCLARSLQRSEAGAGDVLDLTEGMLLEEILSIAPSDPRTGAALLGVSLPTFRRRKERLLERR
jgi:diguanylate cyclase (GGDEF)-like protein